MLEIDELDRGSLLELFRKEIALYLCRSVSDDTYGKNCRDAWLVEPAKESRPGERERDEISVRKGFTILLQRVLCRH